MNTPDAIDLEMSRQRAEIDVELLHLAQARLADDLLRAMTLLGCGDVVVNKPALRAVTPLPTGGAVSSSGPTKDMPYPVRAGQTADRPAPSLPHWSGSVGQQPIHDKPAPGSAETARGGSWHPSSEWREACRDDIERRINL